MKLSPRPRITLIIQRFNNDKRHGGLQIFCSLAENNACFERHEIIPIGREGESHPCNEGTRTFRGLQR